MATQALLLGVKWNLSNPNTLGAEESVLISGVELYTDLAHGTAKTVLFIKVSSFQGVLIRGILQYIYHGVWMSVFQWRHGRSYSMHSCTGSCDLNVWKV